MAEGDDEMTDHAESDGSDDVTATRDDAGSETAEETTAEDPTEAGDETPPSDQEDTSKEGADDATSVGTDEESQSGNDSGGTDSPEEDDAAEEPRGGLSQVPGLRDGTKTESSSGDSSSTDSASADSDATESSSESDSGDVDAPESDVTEDESTSDSETDVTEDDSSTDSDTDDSSAESATADDTTSAESSSTDVATAEATPPDTTANGGFEGAPDDEEMPLTVHIEEMLKRLVAVIVVMGGVSLLIFPIAPDLINWLWYSFLPGSSEACVGGAEDTTACPRVYHPLGLLFARIKVASLAGFVIALPVLVYQSYLFMRPGLYPHERRYYLAAVPTSLLLAFVGLAFSYFLVLPFIFTYFLFYSEDVAEIAFGLTETFDLILLMMGMFAAIFQIPLFIMLAIMMGVTTRHWLEEKRYYFWLGFAGFAFLFSPDPTGMAPFMVGITMVILYELTLLLLRWTGR